MFTKCGWYEISLYQARNSFLDDLEGNSTVPGLYVCFSKGGAAALLNGLFTQDGIRGMLDGKFFQCIEMLLSSFRGFLDRAAGYADMPFLINVNALDSDIRKLVAREPSSSGVYKQSLAALVDKVREFKRAKVYL